jgi:ribosomal protein L15E
MWKAQTNRKELDKNSEIAMPKEAKRAGEEGMKCGAERRRGSSERAGRRSGQLHVLYYYTSQQQQQYRY